VGPGAGIRAPDRPAGRLLTVRMVFNTLWAGDADLHLYITTVQDG